MNFGFEKIVSRTCAVGTQARRLYSFLAQTFLQLVGLENEYRMRNRGMNIVKIVDNVDVVDKEVENLTRGR